MLSTRQPAARIQVGNHFAMTGGALVADTLISIGNNVTIGSDCIVVDTDFHPLEAERRKSAPNAGRSEPVIIEDDVFVGMRSFILKGAVVGRGSVIGAGSVVSAKIPPGVIAAGNPIRIIGPVNGPAGV